MSSTHSMRELFDALVELGEEERRARLASLALSEPDMQRLQALLAADTSPATVLAGSAERLIECLAHSGDAVQQMIGSTIGSFRLVEAIGEGGSSVVFRAERPAGEAVQTVALKLIFGGNLSSNIRRRSLREQAILAQLSHPGIARLVEAGSTGFGVPYLAMEHVDGEPVTRYADGHSLGLRQRIELVLALCAAVAAAHAALVVHCDLKPSNVFVDRHGTLKVLDFGVARLLDPDGGGGEATRSIAFTPEYGAPEQHRAGPPTVAVDVYAIGVLLAELLTGMRLHGADGPASARVLAGDARPAPPGMPTGPALARCLRGDLDAILRMATADAPGDRYAAVGALAADLGNYLAGQPVSARRATRRYRARKFIERNRAGVALSALLLAGLLTSALHARQQATEARASAELARAQAERADAMRESVFDFLAEADSGRPGQHEVTVLAAAEGAIERMLADRQMETRARLELLGRFGYLIGRYGRIERARQVLQTAYDEALPSLGAGDPVTLGIGASLVHFLGLAGRDREARALLDSLQPRVPVDLEDLRVRLLSTSSSLALRERDPARAEREGRLAVELSRGRVGEGRRRITLGNFGHLLQGLGRSAEAIPVLEEALALTEARFGPQHETIAPIGASLSHAHRALGEVDRAVLLARRAIDIEQAAYGHEHPSVAAHLNALSMAQRLQHDWDGALASALECLRIYEATLGVEHPRYRAALGGVGVTYMHMERYKEAQPLLLDALQRESAADGAGSPRAAVHRGNLGFVFGMQGDTVAGVTELERAIADLGAASPPEPWRLASAILRRARLALHQGDVGSAMAWIDPLATAVSAVPASGAATWVGRVDLLRAEALLVSGQAAEAVSVLKRVDDAFAAQAPVDPAARVEQQLLLAGANAAIGNATQARELAAQARTRLAQLPQPPQRLLRMASSLPE